MIKTLGLGLLLGIFHLVLYTTLSVVFDYQTANLGYVFGMFGMLQAQLMMKDL